MGFFVKKLDKQSGEGLPLTEWNDLCNAVAGNAGLTLAVNETDQIGIGRASPAADIKLAVQGNASVSGNVKIGPTASSPDIRLSVQGNVTVPVGNLGIGTNSAALAPISISTDAGKEQNPDGSMHFTNDCILFGGNNKGREANSAQISAGKHVADSLNIVGMSSPNNTLRKVDIFAEGGVTVNGKVAASGFIGDGSQLTNLSVGTLGLNLATTGGNVGIGTTTPSAKIHLVCTAGPLAILESKYEHAYLQILTKEGINNRIELCNRPGGRAVIWVNQAGDALNVLPNGNVGIGTTTPTEKLEINGALRLNSKSTSFKMYLSTPDNSPTKELVFELNNSTHNADKTPKVVWDGDNNWDFYSDERLKTGIENEENILDRLMELDVKNYNWKSDPDRKLKMIGFIAQKVKPLFPALVGEVEDENTKERTMTLKYGGFGVLAVGAIKELKSGYDKRISALEKEMAVIKSAYNDKIFSVV